MKSPVIVIPTYNESTNLEQLFSRILLAVPNVNILLVDDASPDGTADLAETIAGNGGYSDQLRVLRRTGPRGLGRAYRDGFALALKSPYDFIIQMDADLSHDPAYLPGMIALCENADLVIGSRYCPGGALKDWPRYRRWLSRFAGIYVRSITHLQIADVTAGFRCWRAAALKRVDFSSVISEGYTFLVEMSYRAYLCDLKIIETPITFVDRTCGQSKISRSVLFESAIVPWKLRFSKWKAPANSIVNSSELEAGENHA